jgi:hypothetical protein
MVNIKINKRTLSITAIGAMLLATTVISMSTENAVAYKKNQATSQTNDCGNGFEPTNIGCQNTGSQIQGDKNTVSLSSRQTFPPPMSNIEYRKLLRGN